MNVCDARGTGNSPERSPWLGGDENLIALPIKSKIEVVATDDLQEALIDAVVDNARTGEPGDGKIFVEAGRGCDTGSNRGARRRSRVANSLAVKSVILLEGR